MTSNGFRKAGFLAMTSAILSIPFLILSVQLADVENMASSLIQAAMQLVGTCLFVYLTVTLKRFLNNCHSFHGVDDYIDFLISTNLIFSLAAVASLFIPRYQNAIDKFCLILIVVFGVANLLFGFKILRASDMFPRMFKPYGILTIITGAFMATIVLLPLGVITGAVSDVMLGTIFFQAFDKTVHPDAE